MTNRIHEDFWAINPVFINQTQTFASPGTWNRPPTTTWVEVFVVGGGGGGGKALAAPGPVGGNTGGGGGGGGSVIRKYVPVSGPVPVTVGAGGTKATVPAISTGGGISAFGPIGPGPVPAIPSSTVYATGGSGGSSGATEGGLPTYINAQNYPIDGMGKGGQNITPNTGPGTIVFGGGARNTWGRGAGNWGGGGNSPMKPFFSDAGAGGDSGPPASTTTLGTDGQAGLVFVRWKE